MRNEFLLLSSVLLIYGCVLIGYRLFGKNGLFAMTVLSTVFANIEVLILINAFGMEQTLGNVMFASTYLITDILSENEGKEHASHAVWLGVFASAVMLLFTQYFLLYEPSGADWASPHLHAIFSTTPRMMFASFVGYIISQRFDVWLYHVIWDFTIRKTGNRKRLLWLRNNAATLIAQIINTIIFNLIAFAGWYDTKTLISIMLSSYVIYIFTTILNTPAVYLGRWMKEKGLIL